MRLIFTAEYAGLWLLLTGLIILMFLYSKRRKKERAMRFGNYKTLEKVAGGDFLRSDNLIMIIRVLAVTVLLIGLSSPVVVQEVMGGNSDYVLALDASASMFTSDIEPNRFEAAKDISGDFVSELGNSTNIGVVSYSGEVIEEQAVTDDHALVQTAIENIEMGETPGTATGDAVATSASMLIGKNQTKSVLLVTDGRNNVGQSINESIDFANRHNITVYPIGIGDPGEADNLEQDTEFIHGEEATRAEFPDLNQTRLNRLAENTGGEAIFVSNRDGLETAFIELTEEEEEEEIAQYFFLLAGILLVIDALIRTTDFQIIP